MLNALIFVANVAILFFILRFRIHIHVEYESDRNVRKRRKVSRQRASEPGKGEAGEVQYSGEGTVSPAILKDLRSALRNLEATGPEAEAMVAQAIRSGARDFDNLLLAALSSRREGVRPNPRRRP